MAMMSASFFFKKLRMGASAFFGFSLLLSIAPKCSIFHDDTENALDNNFFRNAIERLLTLPLEFGVDDLKAIRQSIEIDPLLVLGHTFNGQHGLNQFAGMSRAPQTREDENGKQNGPYYPPRSFGDSKGWRDVSFFIII